MITALGAVWIPDGLEITLAGGGRRADRRHRALGRSHLNEAALPPARREPVLPKT
jgi:hypothetical protein